MIPPFTGGTNDQCFPHSTPSRIHCSRTAIASGLSGFLWESSGGMNSSGSSDFTRLISSLSSGLPGTITLAMAPSRVSRRNFALRAAASNPWQAKQLSERMGRTSRLKSTGSSARTVDHAARRIMENCVGRRNLMRMFETTGLLRQSSMLRQKMSDQSHVFGRFALSGFDCGWALLHFGYAFGVCFG